MKTIQISIKDKLAIITLDRGRSNPINAEMVLELTFAIKEIKEDDGLEGLIITGKEGFFSAGIDLIEVCHYDQDQSKEFWSNFLALEIRLLTFKKPLVAAITGHSPAGGCVMALCCDYRVMAKGNFIIGLNEIPVGIIVPDAIFHLYSFWIGKHKAYQYLLEGKLLNVDEAFHDGLIDEITAPEDLLAAAEQKIRFYMKQNPITWQQSKMNFRKELSAHFQKDQSEALDKMLQQWWSPEIRLSLQKTIEKLNKATVKS
ncbi:enoyl-CoA hydratase/isomerase family protein [Mucilaginibacter arboris]|uniref:Enoyl-CoA hydratase/isomerase family protein n=1 Tax=Mucilaginibacter arboris TaxID=2682090 RepID=A0A7K1SZ85_9SPHI|nr:enoyl-CoA hydratase/isomerase family protein [Mucilaginibacter arboris]MVN22631.1 enoyl-CoA hydratase/isomerase family protein [Mucilaginibacter arboris]